MSSKKIARYVLLFLLIASGLGIALNGQKVTDVKVTLRPGAEEPKDRSVLGIGRGSAPPDYRLELRDGKDWVDCGTFLDTNIGAGLHFGVPGTLAMNELVELRLREVDKVSDDDLERLSVTGVDIEGEAFAFELATRFDFWVGLGWFLETPLGMLVATGVVIAVAFLALSTISLEV